MQTNTVPVHMPDGSIRDVPYDTVSRTVPGREYRSGPYPHLADVMLYAPVVEIPGYTILRTVDGRYHATLDR